MPTVQRLSEATSREIRKRLVTWYSKEKRNLPWRQTKDPYAIWISEIMLQQTRVDTVIPYYERFLKEFPTVEALADAREERVLKKWEGLGYYSRARNLHSAAREMVERYGGELPQRKEELQSLKGFGPYTSGAVASIAFGEAVPAVDGNVIRVYSRLFATNKNIPLIAQKLVEPKDPSSFNQSVMELGALVCLPKNPKCLLCPLRTICRAQKLGRVEEFPSRNRAISVKTLRSFAFVVQSGNSVLLRRRPSKGLWGGLWEFPMLEAKSLNQATHRFETEFKIKPLAPRKVGRLKHQLSHRTIDLTIYSSAAKKKTKGEGWVSISSLQSLPFSRLARRVEEAAFGRREENRDLPLSHQRTASPPHSAETA